MLAAAAILCVAAAAVADEVQVRAEKITYPVSEGKHRAGIAPDQAAKLKGKPSYTTEAVILENRYLRLTVLPELGGRLVRAIYKPTGADLFWVNDQIQDGVSWSMGGGRFSFPFWEHGRHFDETGGWCVVRHAGGGATLAIDMRFDEFLRPEETRRYGRATCLRLAQFVRLEPDASMFTWTGRVENPLPIRCGFKLWNLLRQPAAEGIRIIMPAAAVTGHGARSLEPWDYATKTGGHIPAAFAVGMRHGFAGWHFEKQDLNVLRVADPAVAPGSKQVLYPPSERGYIEMWTGNNEVFEECGRILPPFGAYEMRLAILAARGIGPADFANEHAAVSCRKVNGEWRVAIAPTRALRGAEVILEGDGQQVSSPVAAADPETPIRLAFERPAERLTLRLVGADGGDLVSQTFPIDRGPMPQDAFALVQARTQGTMPGDQGLYAEATDLVSEHQLSLPRAAAMQEKVLEASDDVRDLLDAARRLMRVRRNDPKVLAGLEKVLAKQPENPWANLYKAMWLIEADRPDELRIAALQRAASLPGGRYLLALEHIRRGRIDEAKALLESILDMPPAAAFYGPASPGQSPASPGRSPDDPALRLMQPGAVAANAQPRLLLAVLYAAERREEKARPVLEALVQADPALIEAWSLLGDAEKVETLTRANPSGKRAAEENLAALRAARWPGIGRP